MHLLTCFHMQDNPELEYTGWKRISSMPELNFLSQIVMLLFEDESRPLDSNSRYYVHLHIGCGVKARKQTFSDGVPFIDGETHSPSFVKRLPTMPAHRDSETHVPPQSLPGVRKIASYPIIHDIDNAPNNTPPQQRIRNSNSFSTIVVNDASPTSKTSPDSLVKKLSIGYNNDESLHSLGVPG